MAPLDPGIDWDRIEAFIGFGSPHASVWFIGMEEGLQRDADLSADLLSRGSYAPYEDLYEAQLRLGGPGKFFGDRAGTQRTWRPMCHLMLRKNGNPSPTKEDRVRYQAERLGRRDGETLLSELMPYPNTGMGEWRYEERFTDRDAYMSAMLERRIALLRGVVNEGSFDIIVAYGAAYWPLYRRLFDGVAWTEDGDVALGYHASTRIVLAHHFSGRSFNTEAQLNRFSDLALGTASHPSTSSRGA